MLKISKCASSKGYVGIVSKHPWGGQPKEIGQIGKEKEMKRSDQKSKRKSCAIKIKNCVIAAVNSA